MTIPNVVTGEVIDATTFGNAVVDELNANTARIDAIDGKYLPLTGGTVTGDLQVDGNSDLKVNVPADAWGAASGTVFTVQGMVGGTQGSYGMATTSNGYRNNGGKWTSLGLNDSVGAATMELLPTGTFWVRTASNHPTGSAAAPPVRFSVTDSLTRCYYGLQVDGTVKAALSYLVEWQGMPTAPVYSFAKTETSGMYGIEGVSAGTAGDGDGVGLTADGLEGLKIQSFRPNSRAGVAYPVITVRALINDGVATASAANVHVKSDGGLRRSTSSRATMDEVEPVNREAAASVLDLAPIWFRSTCEGDDPTQSHYGLAAEDVAAVDPRLATYATDDDGETVAEHVNLHAVTALLLAEVKTQSETIAELTARLEQLEA